MSQLWSITDLNGWRFEFRYLWQKFVVENEGWRHEEEREQAPKICQPCDFIAPFISATHYVAAIEAGPGVVLKLIIDRVWEKDQSMPRALFITDGCEKRCKIVANEAFRPAAGHQYRNIVAWGVSVSPARLVLERDRVVRDLEACARKDILARHRNIPDASGQPRQIPDGQRVWFDRIILGNFIERDTRLYGRDLWRYLEAASHMMRRGGLVFVRYEAGPSSGQRSRVAFVWACDDATVPPSATASPERASRVKNWHGRRYMVPGQFDQVRGDVADMLRHHQLGFEIADWKGETLPQTAAGQFGLEPWHPYAQLVGLLAQGARGSKYQAMGNTLAERWVAIRDCLLDPRHRDHDATLRDYEELAEQDAEQWCRTEPLEGRHCTGKLYVSIYLALRLERPPKPIPL